MKGVTRKERIINAMLEGDASACAGVSREERNLAKVAQATCNGELGGGGSGGGWDAVIKLNDNLGYASSAEITLVKGDYAALCAKALTGEPVMIAGICDYVYGSHRVETHIATKVFFYDVDESDEDSANRIFVTFGGANSESVFTIKEDNTVVFGEVHD